MSLFLVLVGRVASNKMMKINKIHVVLIFFTTLITVSIGLKYLQNYYVTHYYETKASEKTTLWINHFMKRLPKLGLNLEAFRADPVISTIAVGRSVELAGAIIKSSELFQIDFVNPDCLCTISVGSYASKRDNDGHLVGLTRDKANAVFLNRHKTGVHKPHFQNNKRQLAVNFQRARDVIKGGKNTIFFFNSDHADLPAAYAAVYSMANVHDEQALLIRALVPLVNEAQFISMTTYAALAFLSLISSVALYYGFKVVTQAQRPAGNMLQMPSKKRSNAFAILFILVGLAVIVGSYYSPDFSDIWNSAHDKIKHTSAYFVLTFVGLIAFHHFNSPKRLLVTIFAMGLIIELTQPLTGRSSSLYDLMANSVGIILGALLVVWLSRKFLAKQNYGIGLKFQQT